MMKKINRFSTIFALALMMFSYAFAGDPIPGLDVRLEQTDGGKVFTCKTDADGNFSVMDCPEGTYTVSFSYKGASFSFGQTNSSSSSSAKTLEVKSPRDVATGQSSGKRMHKPITITKEWGKSSPLLSLKVDGTTISGSVSLRESPTKSSGR